MEVNTNSKLLRIRLYTSSDAPIISRETWNLIGKQSGSATVPTAFSALGKLVLLWWDGL